MTFRDKYVSPSPGGPALVVGSRVVPGKDDDRLLFKGAIGVDLESGPGVNLVHDMERPLPPGIGPFSHVHCVSVLEHCRRPWLVAENIERCLASNGTIYVRVPSVWRHHDYPGDYWRFLGASMAVLFPKIVWVTMRYEDPHGELHPPTRLPTPEDVEKTFLRCELHAFGVNGGVNAH